MAPTPRHLFQVGRARDCLVSPVASLPIGAGTFLLHFPRQQVDTFTDFENHAKLRPSHRINTFAVLTAPPRAGAGKRSKPLSCSEETR
jgi:hypothetical protein